MQAPTALPRDPSSLCCTVIHSGTIVQSQVRWPSACVTAPQPAYLGQLQRMYLHTSACHVYVTAVNVAAQLKSG
jgi:hypothetical protein